MLREICPNIVFSGLNAEKYGQEKTPYLDTFHEHLHKMVNGLAHCSHYVGNEHLRNSKKLLKF